MNPLTLEGDIGVAKSMDKGATWEQLGIALNEEWHLSFPYVFDYLGQVRPFFFAISCIILDEPDNFFMQSRMVKTKK